MVLIIYLIKMGISNVFPQKGLLSFSNRVCPLYFSRLLCIVLMFLYFRCFILYFIFSVEILVLSHTLLVLSVSLRRYFVYFLYFLSYFLHRFFYRLYVFHSFGLWLCISHYICVKFCVFALWTFLNKCYLFVIHFCWIVSYLPVFFLYFIFQVCICIYKAITSWQNRGTSLCLMVYLSFTK